MKKHVLLFIAFTLLTLNMTLAQNTNVLRVDTSESLGTISPYVYSANMGQYSIVPPDLMPQAQALGLHYIRYGGGFSDQGDLRESVIDLFMYQVRQMGAEPAMTVRLLNGTPEDAAYWVQYANVEKDYNIRFWSIGNEPHFFEALMGAESYTPQDLGQNWRVLAEAMLEVDPTITLVGPDVGPEATPWLREFLRVNGDLVDIVAIHRYPYPGAGRGGATIDGLRANSKEWDTIIPDLRKLIRDETGRDIPVGVTEVNSNSSNDIGGEASLDSFYNALWLGDVLGRLIRQGVEIVGYWDIQNPVQGWGLMSSYDLRPTYYTYIMYSHFGTERLASESSDPNVGVYAALRDDGTLTLLVINLGDDEATKTLSLNGFRAGSEAEVWRFDADHNAEQIDSIDITDGGTITVPGQSMTLYAVPGKN
jgi:hypothetical protein